MSIFLKNVPTNPRLPYIPRPTLDSYSSGLLYMKYKN